MNARKDLGCIIYITITIIDALKIHSKISISIDLDCLKNLKRRKIVLPRKKTDFHLLSFKIRSTCAS